MSYYASDMHNIVERLTWALESARTGGAMASIDEFSAELQKTINHQAQVIDYWYKKNSRAEAEIERLRKRGSMATIDELNADFVTAYNDLVDWLTTEVPDQYIPFMGNIREMMRSKLDSPQGRAKLLQLVEDIMKTDEAWRAAHPAGSV